ncbi:MAG: von Willebrand factor type A domain-containing protein [Deltaproteobacteria bacterium]|nr:von Willebrand factor type A domain-containing protein [Deltaproteobacteria bacterium]
MKIDEDDPKWTAYVLGELSDLERVELERILEDCPEARAYVAELRTAIGAIETELKAQPPLALDDLQRRRILHKAAAAPPPRRARRVWFLAGTGAAAAALTVALLGRTAQDDATPVEAPRKLENDEISGKAEAALGWAVRADGAQLRLAVGGKGNWNQPAGGDVTGQAGRPDTEAYKHLVDNPFKRTLDDPLSTFSIDVDTASYANVRRFLAQHQLPPPDAVRIEEMINYFTYSYPEPRAGEPFSISTEVGPAPWNARHKLVRIGLQAPEIAAAKVPPRNLVFLVDTSGSMSSPDKLPLLVQSLGLLVDNLRPEDHVSIVVYAGSAGLVLPPTSGARKDDIRDALARLAAGGSTNGGAGIQLAYDTARGSFLPGGINRVILCSDGDYNVGTTSEGDLTRLIEKEREHGVFLTVLGFGTGNVKDATMEMLADKGNGNYAYIDSLFEARKVLVAQAGATLVTVAKDVKLQVELNPTAVAGYRLIGYENRVLAHQDFNDDGKDAGEIGAGHAVTALYEIIPAGLDVPGAANVDPLKYQRPPAPATPAASADELMTVKVRYKEPQGAASKLLSRTVASTAAAATSDDYRWAAAIAAFGMKLRDSKYSGDLSWSEIHALAEGAIGPDAAGYRKQAVQLITAALRLPSRP